MMKKYFNIFRHQSAKQMEHQMEGVGPKRRNECLYQNELYLGI